MGLISKIFNLTILIFIVFAVFVYFHNPETFNNYFHKATTFANNNLNIDKNIDFGNLYKKSNANTPNLSSLKSLLNDYYKNKGLNLEYISTKGPELIVNISTMQITSSLMDSAAQDIYKINTLLENYSDLNRDIYRISVNYFYVNNSLFEMSTLREYLVDNESFAKNVEIKDLRTTRFKIESDSWVFDYTIDNVFLNDTSVVIKAVPESDNIYDSMNDLVNMAFVALQDAPYVKYVNVVLELDNESVSFHFPSDNLTDYMSGDLDFETLINLSTKL